MKAVGLSAAGGVGTADGNAGRSTGGRGSGRSITTAGFSDGAWAHGITRARSGSGGSSGRGAAPIRSPQATEALPTGSRGVAGGPKRLGFGADSRTRSQASDFAAASSLWTAWVV